MNVLIDADGYPVVDIAIRICRECGISYTLLCDTAHTFHRADADILVFDKGADSVDFAIVTGYIPETSSSPRITVWLPCVLPEMPGSFTRTAGSINHGISTPCSCSVMNPESCAIPVAG